jgi:hypothetical protein
MAKIYGGRWRIVDDHALGQGGQSHVFRVVDSSSLLPGEYALKRVLNPKRHDRFRTEVQVTCLAICVPAETSENGPRGARNHEEVPIQ